MTTPTNHHGVRSVSERVIEEVADETGTDPLELEPLYRVVDPECLDGLFRDVSPSTPRNAGHVTFRMAGCQVTVSHDGTVEAHLDDEDAVSTVEAP